MAVEDYLESEVAVAVAATAAVLSPKVRGVLRQGAVYGLAGVLMAGDALGSFVRSIGRGAQQAAAATAGAATTATGREPSSPPPATPDEAADRLSAETDAGTERTHGSSRRGPRAAGAQVAGTTDE